MQAMTGWNQFSWLEVDELGVDSEAIVLAGTAAPN